MFSVPKNYVVWGTGTFQNPGSVLQPEFAQRLQKSMTSDEIVHISNFQEMRSHAVTNQSAC